MSDAPDLRDEEMLARLAEFDLSAAERVHGRLMAAEETSEIAELGRTYQRFSRSLRQTLALKAKLKRDREQGAREAATAKPGAVAVARRRRELSEAVTRVIWDEAEDDETAFFSEEFLEGLIAEGCLQDDFCADPLDDHVARVCRELGLSPDRARRWRDLRDPDAPDAEGDAPPAGGLDDPEPAWRGSG